MPLPNNMSVLNRNNTTLIAVVTCCILAGTYYFFSSKRTKKDDDDDFIKSTKEMDRLLASRARMLTEEDVANMLSQS